MLTLSGISGHQRRSWGFSTSQRTRVIVFFHQPLPSENKTNQKRNIAYGKKILTGAEEDETGGNRILLYEII